MPSSDLRRDLICLDLLDKTGVVTRFFVISSVGT